MKNNRIFFGVTILSFVFFALVIAYGGKTIYDKERGKEDGNAAAELFFGAEVVKEFFSDVKRDLLFLGGLPVIKDYAEHDLRSSAAPIEMLANFFNSYQYVHSLSIINPSGQEKLRIETPGNTAKDARRGVAVHEAGLRNVKTSDYFIEAMKLSSGQVYVSELVLKKEKDNLKNESRPLVYMAAPIFNSKGEIKCVLLAETDISEMMGHLSGKIVIQDSSGYMLAKDGKGNISLGKSAHIFKGMEGTIAITATESVRFLSVEIFSGRKLFVAIYDSHRILKTALTNIILVSLVIFTLYFCLMLALSYRNMRTSRELEDSQKAIIFSLANLAEWRDPETGYHLERTRNYGIILAKQLRTAPKYQNIIDDGFMEDLYNSAPLHDIGKVGVRDAVLLKEGKLTAEEFEDIKKHVMIGKNILNNVIEKFKMDRSFLGMSRNIAAFHHEKYDGSGYTEGLKGDEIPLEARIYALCDAYDAIRAKRPYKEPVPHEDAIDRLKAGSGRHFDPDVVEAFLRCEKEFMEVYETYKFFVERYDLLEGAQSRKDLKVNWTDDLTVGIKDIDTQHKELIARINNMFDAIITGKGKEEISGTLRFLEDYVIMHFGMEEELMLNCDYPDYSLHLSQHMRFIEKLSELKNKFETQGASSELVIDLNRHVVEWLINHICKVDKNLGLFLNARV